jgi:hypothetical protein
VTVGIAPAALLRTSRFAPNSRYFGIQTATHQTPDGRQVTYLTRRFISDPSKLHLLQEHLVQDQSERIDNLAAQVLGDPLQFWRICDANGALRPVDLVRVGATIRITLPEGVTGLNSA